ncbi:Ig-like domain-containing protein [Morganella psychrotolerans]|uniref:Big-1 domain-containing protein n=1 Tax=Morganella psychrotolerans TaxID=368603 RepID=A0A1B8HN15_9GAMM|nr:Ig-like domain-containing protein [Morganella psychrotolerans]OBU10829.1 hypothetical protein AYY18_02455 [Morganella psychrotolerans]
MPVTSYYSKTKRVTAYLLLFLQLFFPISVATSSVAYAIEQDNAVMMSDTFDGLNALIDTSPAPSEKPAGNSSAGHSGSNNFTVQMPAGSEFGVMPADPGAGFISGQNGMTFPMSVSTLPDPAKPAPRDNTVRTDDIFSALPTMGLPDISPEDDAAASEAKWAGNASQAGQILSSDDAVNASVGYARSLGENLLNQQVNDWLNQVGHARIQFGSNKTGDADLLIPLVDNPNSLLFSQFGIRANDERTTTNLGLGYRQYEEGWMWGLNSFYDYDITGSNSRVGVGGELWADYVKFAANGYFRVTDWHQSTLNEMRDYDERPANGFDVRAEGYLPDYPQLGAFAKYEQYFGDGISLAGTTSSGELKNNPSVSTVGISYTPFPLITFKGETSRGDSNDSKVGMELSYRFGVPLSQQLDTENVDLMRNLAGNRYDFVDRNYNIVMQYRKQELLRIGLPPELKGEAAQTLPVTASVLKAKYGLKSLRWSAPELEANGGEIRQTGLTTVDITLPEYVFMTRTGAPQGYRVTAVGTDNEGNLSNTAEMWVNVIPSTETITKLTVTPNRELLANNSDQFTAVALLQSDTGGVLANKAVTFSVSGLKNAGGVTIFDAEGNSGQTLTVITGADGTATIKIISKSAGKGLLKAKMRNGNSRTEAIVFVADSSTAKIKTLELTHNKALANGQEKNIALTTVTDQFDNPVNNFTLNARADNGATVVNATAQTDESGRMTTQFSSEIAGDSKLVVEGAGTSKSVTAQFIADISTAKIQSVVITHDNAIADGKAKNGVLVTVTDNRNNPLTGAPVTITVPGTARYQTQPVSGVTDSRGQLQVDITNTKAAQENYTFSINNSSETRQLTFIADETTATITDSRLVIVTNNQLADGVAANQVKATVVDKYNNRVPNIVVEFKTNHDAIPQQAQLTTDSNGEVVFNLTNTLTGATVVIAGLNNTSATKTVMFTADSSTAEILSNNMTVVVDNSPANGTTKNRVKAIVTDARGNLVPYVSVTFTTDNGASPASLPLLTDEQGEVFFNLTNTVATPVSVTAQVNANQMTKTVTFIADTSTAQITDANLTVTQDNQPANGVAKNQVRAVVTDARNNPVPDTDVIFYSNNGAQPDTLTVTTNAQGEAVFDVTNIRAGKTTITISLNGKNKVRNVTFAPDKSTATVTDANLIIVKDRQPANGTAHNIVKAIVTDAQGNLVPDTDVIFTATNGAQPGTKTVTSDVKGVAVYEITNVTTGEVTVTARIGSDTPVSKVVTFVADSGTAEIIDGNLVVVENNQPANGTAKNQVKATVTDAQGNTVPDADVVFTSDNGAAPLTNTVRTNAQGVALFSVSNTRSGVTNIIASINGHDRRIAVTFVADSTTAVVSELTIVTNKSPADGVTPDKVKAVIKDGNGNLISGYDMVFRNTTGALPENQTITTNTQGEAEFSLTSTTAGNYVVTAAAGLSVKNVTVTFVADSSTADITAENLTIIDNNKVANGAAQNRVKAVVTDAKGNKVPDVDVIFVADNGALPQTQTIRTNNQGEAIFSLTNTLAGDTVVTAHTGEKPAHSVTTVFEADKTTGQISGGKLIVIDNNSPANGVAKNRVKAVVTDAKGNPVPGSDVLFRTNNNAQPGNQTVVTNAQGEAEFSLSNTLAGDTNITAGIVGLSGTDVVTPVTFIADSTTADITDSNLIVIKNDQLADGKAKNQVKAIVTDAEGNRVPGMEVVFTSSNGALPATETLVTDAQGEAVFNLTNTTAGAGTVNAKLKGETTGPTVNVNFEPNQGTAKIDEANLIVIDNNKAANGVAQNRVKAIVTDEQGNIVPNVRVSFSADNGALPASQLVQTNNLGEAFFVVTNILAGPVSISASINGHSVSKNVTFVADISTAKVVSLSSSKEKVTANGTDTATLTVTVKDEQGNPVPGNVVTLSTTAGQLNTPSVTTDATGQATVTLKGTVAGDAVIKATNSTDTIGQSVTVILVPDTATASVVTLTTDADTIIANGTAKATLTVTVKDAQGNVVPGNTVNLATTLGTLSEQVVVTNNAGLATFSLTGTRIGDATVHATNSTDSTGKEVIIHIVPDSSTMTIKSVLLDGDKTTKVANNADNFTYIALIQDANGNPVSGVTVTATADNTDAVVSVGGTTDTDGQVTITLAATTKAMNDVLVSAALNGATAVDANKLVSYIFDIDTAKVSSVTLTDDETQKIANGSDSFSYVAQLTDGNGNKILQEGLDVKWIQNQGAKVVLSENSTKTNAQGLATVTLKSTTEAADNVRVSAQYATKPVVAADKNVSFIYNMDSAHVSKVTLEGDKITQIADGVTYYTFTAQLTDENNNPIRKADLDVKWTQDKGDKAVLSGTTSKTDAGGKATIRLTSTTTAVDDIRVSAQYLEIAAVPANKTVSFTYNLATAKISTVALTGDVTQQVADGDTYFTYTAQLVDKFNNPILLADREVKWTQNKSTSVVLSGTTSKTDATGKATITLKSTTKAVADVLVSAQYQDNAAVPADKTVDFIYELASAKVSTVELNGDVTQQIADGITYFTYTAQLVDKNNNPILLADREVEWTQNKGTNVTLFAATSKTDATGKATIKLTSTATAVDDVLVSAKYPGTAVVPANKTIDFTYDLETAKISTVELSGDVTVTQQIADGIKFYTFTAQLVDVNNNPINQANLDVKWTQDKGSDVVLSATTSKTDATGKATIKLTSTTKAVSNITVSAQYKDMATIAADKKVSFTYDLATARVGTVALFGDVTQQIADGITYFTYTAQLVDKYNNPILLADQDVKWTQNKGTDVVLSAETSKTDATGKTTITLKSTKKSVDDVIVSAQYLTTVTVPADKKISFIADATTARISSVNLKGEITRKVANGTNTFIFVATVTDVNGNPVRNMDVTWSGNKPDTTTLVATAPKTGVDGTVEATLKSSLTPTYDIIVSAAIAGQNKVDANLKVSFEELFKSTITVVDAGKTGTVVIPGARIEIYSENKGEKLVDVLTPANGKVQVELVAGRYAIVITKDEFRTYDNFIEIRSGITLDYQYGLIQIGNNDAKIIVQWLENKPSDPDTYIKVPDGTNVFRNKRDYDGVHLDRDDTKAPGLETITIEKFKPGTYTYALECFSCTWSNFNNTDAKVSVHINDRVTLGAGTSKDTYVTSPGNAVAGTGNTTKFWRVLEISVTSAGVASVKVLNTYSTSF